MKKILISTLLLLSSGAFAGDLPDPKLTPGVTNPAVTQANIQSTICKTGWTKTIRPTVSYTNKLKAKQMAAQNLPGKPSEYEEDHLISLELGGSPTSPQNLWPELWNPPSGWGAHKKDVIETFLKRQVCTGKMSLIDAQKFISIDWIETYKHFIKK